MWVASKPFRYRGVQYKVGDTVPAESWPNRRAFFLTRRIREVVETPPETTALDPSKLKRAELNEYALSVGIDHPEAYSKRDLLLAAVDELLHPKPAADGEAIDESKVENDDSADEGSTADDSEVEAENDDEDPFADLEDDSK